MLFVLMVIALVALGCMIRRARGRRAKRVGAHAPTLSLPTFVRWYYRRPHEVLGLDPNATAQEARDRFLSMFRELAASSHAGAMTGLHMLCFAYNLVVLGSEQRDQKAASNIEGLHEAATHAQERALLLARECIALRHERDNLDEKLAELADAMKAGQQRLCVLEAYARCAPPYFQSLLQFVGGRCSQGPELRVSSSDLHRAFVAYLEAQPTTSTVQAPTQRELRALLEQLGFEYGQMQYKGSNARCFKGLALSAGGDHAVNGLFE